MKSGGSRAAAKDDPGYSGGGTWVRAVAFGFHECHADTDEHVDQVTGHVPRGPAVTDRRLPDADVAAHSLAADVPVATFGTLRKT